MTRPGEHRLLGLPVADPVLAGCLFALGQAEVWTVAEVHRPSAALVVLGTSLPLAWRRRAPLAMTVVVFATFLVTVNRIPIDSLIYFIPAFVIALYSLGAHAEARQAWIGQGIALATVWVAIFAESGPGIENLYFGLVVAVGPWLAGRLVRRRMAQAVALALRAQELERSQEEREQAAVAEERARIARELHDVVAHAVSVMTVQAGAIEEVLDADPEKARAAAGSIRRTGRQALVDLRRMLGLLREGVEEGQFLPQPGLADLDALVEQVRQAGLQVEVAVEGAPRRLPPAVDLSAFRLVQEALTNVLKHAGARRAQVDLLYGPGSVAIDVLDDGTAEGVIGEGHGLLGMRERVALYGGTLEYGREPSGGFRVRAQLPVDTT